MAGMVNAADEGWAFIRASPRFPVAWRAIRVVTEFPKIKPLRHLRLFWILIDCRLSTVRWSGGHDGSNTAKQEHCNEHGKSFRFYNIVPFFGWSVWMLVNRLFWSEHETCSHNGSPAFNICAVCIKKSAVFRIAPVDKAQNMATTFDRSSYNLNKLLSRGSWSWR